VLFGKGRERGRRMDRRTDMLGGVGWVVDTVEWRYWIYFFEVRSCLQHVIYPLNMKGSNLMVKFSLGVNFHFK
jgi:hypothetical protein